MRAQPAANAGVADFAEDAPVPARRFRETHQERKQAHRALSQKLANRSTT